jgi:hypothetical protein
VTGHRVLERKGAQTGSDPAGNICQTTVPGKIYKAEWRKSCVPDIDRQRRTIFYRFLPSSVRCPHNLDARLNHRTSAVGLPESCSACSRNKRCSSTDCCRVLNFLFLFGDLLAKLIRIAGVTTKEDGRFLATLGVVSPFSAVGLAPDVAAADADSRATTCRAVPHRQQAQNQFIFDKSPKTLSGKQTHACSGGTLRVLKSVDRLQRPRYRSTVTNRKPAGKLRVNPNVRTSLRSPSLPY